jgi:hypothetical protein
LSVGRTSTTCRAFDNDVHFPDFRIEYEVDGRDHHEDVEVVTADYAARTPRAWRALDFAATAVEAAAADAEGHQASQSADSGPRG